MQLPSPQAPFLTSTMHRPPPCTREHRERRVLREGRSYAEGWYCHNSTRGHCTSRRSGRIMQLFSLPAELQAMFQYGWLASLYCALVVSADSSKPSHLRPKLRFIDSSSSAGLRHPATLWLLPGASFPCIYDLLLAVGVAHRSAVKQRPQPGSPRGSKPAH